LKEDKADITVIAKSMSAGFYPISGILISDEIAGCVKKGEHGSTFGGNSLAMAIAKRSVELLYEEKMIENSAKMGAYLNEQVNGIQSYLIKDVRGRGLFQGVEFDHSAKVSANDLSTICLENGLLSKATHDYVLRLTPALVITKTQVDEGIEILSKSIKQLEQLNEERSK